MRGRVMCYVRQPPATGWSCGVEPRRPSVTAYDPNGIKVQAGDTNFLIDPNNPTGYAQVFEEKTTGGTLTKSYVIGDDVLSQAIGTGGGGGVYHLLYDGHGSTRALSLNTAPSTLGPEYDFDAYGNALSDIANAATSLLYAGEYLATKAGQYYLRARHYDAASGRFNRVDPFAGNNSDPQSLHKYQYAHGNPITNTDPSGLMSSTLSILLAIFVIVAVVSIFHNGMLAYRKSQFKKHAGYSYIGNPMKFARDYSMDIEWAAAIYNLEPEYLAAFIIEEIDDLARGGDLYSDAVSYNYGRSATLGVAQFNYIDFKNTNPGASEDEFYNVALDPKATIWFIAKRLRKKADSYTNIIFITDGVPRPNGGKASITPFNESAKYMYRGTEVNMNGFKGTHTSTWSKVMKQTFGFVHDQGVPYYRPIRDGNYEFHGEYHKGMDGAGWGDDVYERSLKLKRDKTYGSE